MGGNTSTDGAIMIGSSVDENTYANALSEDAFHLHFRSASQSFYVNKKTNVVLNSEVNLVGGTDYEVAATNLFTIHNGTAPVANIVDAYGQYSADWNGAGTATPRAPPPPAAGPGASPAPPP